MPVEDWARREMVKDADEWPVDYEAEAGAGNAFQRGIVHAFSALLSDEAMMGAVDVLREAGHDIGGITWRAALRAAIQAVTEGDTE